MVAQQGYKTGGLIFVLSRVVNVKIIVMRMNDKISDEGERCSLALNAIYSLLTSDSCSHSTKLFRTERLGKYTREKFICCSVMASKHYCKAVVTFIVILVSWQPQSCHAEVTDVISDVWNKLWSMSCEYTTTVSRSKRSTTEFPNTNNADEFFQYLYPSLNLNAEEFVAEGARSLSLTSWMDDLAEYWEIECSRARRKALKRNTTRVKSRFRNSTRSTFSSFKNSTGTNASKDVMVDGAEIYQNNSQFLNKTSRQASPDLYGISLPGPGFPDIGSQLGIPTIATPTISPLALKKENKWFQSYGGDIEYFFPLIGFGIPFDGEITLLGFHGFKGIFPYKR